MRLVTDDADALALVELRFRVEELLSRGRHPSGTRVTEGDLAAAGLTIERRASAERNVLCGSSSMPRIPDLPSAHAPLREGPPVALFRGFDPDSAGCDDECDNRPIAERVASRFAAASAIIPLPLSAPTFSASNVCEALRAHGIHVDTIRFETGSWPGQVAVVGLLGGAPVLSGAVALEPRIEGAHATIRAEIRMVADDGRDIAL